MILSYYLSFVDSCARVPVDSSCARDVPVCPWIPHMPACPEAREETYFEIDEIIFRLVIDSRRSKINKLINIKEYIILPIIYFI
jgi:hypothetical protein